jgi:vacuolar protein sorting-associated protein 16
LSIPAGAVLRHWARAKIAKGGDDADVCKLIVEKFDAAGVGADVSYAEVARKAWEVGRRELATQVGLF